jgi:hypothetical protein
MPVGQQPHYHDDREPNMIHHFCISAKLEEQRRSNYSPFMGFE